MQNKTIQIVQKRRRSIFSFFILGLIFSFGCQSKNTVKKLTKVNAANTALERPTNKRSETDKLDGVIYRLPRTVVQVAVTVKRVVKEPGEFVDFAPCFFSGSELDDRTQVKSIKYSIDTPTFSSRGEPDPSETFVVKTKGNYFEAKTLLMEYSPTGMLTKGEASSTNNSVDFTIKAIGTVAALGAGIVKSSSGLGLLSSNIRQDVTFADKSYSIPNVECSKESIHKHLGRITKEVSNLKITAGTAISTYPAGAVIAFTQVDQAKSCVKTANNEPADPALLPCPIAGVAVNHDDARAFETLIQLVPIKEKLTGQDNYFANITAINTEK
ncbi:MAG TPA: DUF4831 family protein, partial [Pyrinomonadaceae bacterium]|nr:DUF4831 family protein [Pyrinomonadaceae bacterium]